MSEATGSLFSVEGRVALITGGGTGIGRGCALVLADHGADIVVVGRRLEPLQGTADKVAALGQRALVLQGDVTDPEECKRVVGRAVDEFGRLDILVNNAGGSHTRPLMSWPPDEWDQVVRLNLSSAWYMSQAAVPAMLDNGKGAIISISSGASTSALPWAAAYGAAKAGLNNLTGSLAAALTGRGIRANAIIVGGVHTEFMEHDIDRHGLSLEMIALSNPLGRLGTPEEIGYGVLFFASDAASFVSGQCLTMSGKPLPPPDPPNWDESKKSQASM